MAISPNYSWPLPDDTDLVKNGAEAIRDLGNAIDTTVNDLGVGLHHIKTVAFSGAVSHSFGSDADPIFSSTYKNYRIILSDLLSAANLNLEMRLRANVTDANGADYNRQSLNALAGSTTAGRINNGTNTSIGTIGSGAGSLIVLELILPFEAKNTSFFAQTMARESGNDPSLKLFTGYHNQAVSYNGITFLGSANFSGTINIYGYKD